MDVRQGNEVAIRAIVTGTITGLNSEDRYRIKIGDTEIWVNPSTIIEDK